jgi:hypothetical protein
LEAEAWLEELSDPATSVIAASGVQVVVPKEGVYAPTIPRIVVAVVAVTDGSTSVEVGPAPASFASACCGSLLLTPEKEIMAVAIRPVEATVPQVIV